MTYFFNILGRSFFHTILVDMMRVCQKEKLKMPFLTEEILSVCTLFCILLGFTLLIKSKIINIIRLEKQYIYD